MPPPKGMDARIRQHIDSLLKQGQSLTTSGGARGLGSNYRSFSTSVKNLAYRLLPEMRYQEIQQEIQLLELQGLGRGAPSGVLEILQGLSTDYEAGILDDWSQTIESNVTYDFMEQAVQLLGGEYNSDFDHVPAAVLAGAVLEDAVRRLCQRQDPPIETELQDGGYRKLDWMIAALQNRNVYNKPKSAQLRSWAAIRNAAAHGRFKEFDRAQVEQMIPGIQSFLADYL